MMVFLALLLALAGAPTGARAEPPPTSVNAGFVSGIWYSINPFFVDDKIRIYAAIQNQSSYDIVGKIRLYDNQTLIGESPFSVIKGRLVEQWADWVVTPGNHTIYAVIVEAKKSEVGKQPEPVALQFASSSAAAAFADLDTDRDRIGNTIDIDDDNDGTNDEEEKKAGTNPLVPDEKPPTPIAADTAKPGDGLAKKIDAASEETKKIIESLLGRSPSTTTEAAADIGAAQPIGETAKAAAAALAEKTRAALDVLILDRLTAMLEEKKDKLQENINQGTNTQPIFADEVKKIEEKTFFKIPNNKKPTWEHLYSWLIGALIYVLNTWWALLILGLLMLRLLWKIVILFRRKDDFED